MTQEPPRWEGLPHWDSYVSRREFDLLLEEFRAFVRRLNDIDTHGTRGTGVLEQRILDLTSDVATLQARMEQTQQDRATNRKWIIGLVFTFAGVVISTLTLLASVLQNAHHP